MSNTVKIVITVLIFLLVADILAIANSLGRDSRKIADECFSLISEKQYEKAIKIGNSIDEKDQLIFVCLGDAYYGIGSIDLALQNYKKAMELQEGFWSRYYSPELNIKIYNGIASIYERKNNYSDAIRYYRKSLSQMRENRRVREEYKEKYRDVLLKISDLYQKIGDQENAEEYRSCAVRLCRDI